MTFKMHESRVEEMDSPRQRTKGGRERDAIAKGLWAILILLTLWRLWAAWTLPVTQDEAYYFDWAHHLAWGYFDHPPAIAFLGIGTLLAPGSALAGRLGTLLVATLTLLVLLRFYRSCGLQAVDLLIALIIASATLPGLASGVLATPDTALALAWALALHEGLAALRGMHKRWLSAGIATGAGLLSKYTMILVGPVFLWAILWADPKALRKPWPYLGALLALLVFAPNLIWNADHDWLTIRFQFGHGFSTETGRLLSSPLPTPESETNASIAPRPNKTSLLNNLSGTLSFLGTQIALWGLLAIPAATTLFRRRGTKPSEGSTVFDPAAKAMLVAGTLVPLAFFALVASFSKGESNWPTMYLLTAPPLLTVALRQMRIAVAITAAGNLLLASFYLLQEPTSISPLRAVQNRILRETDGYEELAQRVATLHGPLFADRYQTLAMTRFYAPQLRASQWPGISRPSEYLRGTITAPVSKEQVEQAGGFLLLTQVTVPPNIPGFDLRSRSRVFYCTNRGLIETPPSGALPCRNPLHRWQLLAYARDPEK